MVGHTNTEMVVLKEVYTHKSVEMESMPHHTGPHGETPGQLGGRGREGRAWLRSITGVLKGRNG